MTAPDVAAIVDGLSEAQRDCFLRGTEIGCVARSKQTADALCEKGLVWREFELFQPRTCDWTPLGLAVRAHILRSERDA